jgi:hypothetical protein
MFRTAVLFAILLAFLPASIAAAQQFPMPLRYVTADGTWDCKDQTGSDLGTLVVLNDAYGFIGTDDKVVGYGKLYRTGEELYDLPVYIIIGGYLKDELGFVGTKMRGPREDYEDFSTGIFFVLIGADSTEVDCVRRLVPDKLQ